jgi:hypothetical protein
MLVPVRLERALFYWAIVPLLFVQSLPAHKAGPKQLAAALTNDEHK